MNSNIIIKKIEFKIVMTIVIWYLKFEKQTNPLVYFLRRLVISSKNKENNHLYIIFFHLGLIPSKNIIGIPNIVELTVNSK